MTWEIRGRTVLVTGAAVCPLSQGYATTSDGGHSGIGSCRSTR